MEWWERLHLTDNPFEKLKGLPDDLSGSLIETAIFKKFSSRMENPRTIFSRVFLIYGKFGSGKTTFFSYLANKCRSANIKPILITSNFSLTDGNAILEEIKNKLSKEIKYYKDTNLDETDILNGLAIYKDEKKCNGFVLFIDELHRNSNMDAVLTFLQLLQGLTENIFANNIPLAVFIAGREDWEDRIRKESVYSGSIDVFESMGHITPDEGYQIVTKRLKLVAEPGYIKNTFITKQAIEKLYENLSEKTPRELLSKVEQQFKNLSENKFILDATDIGKEVDPNVIDTIRRRLQSAGRVHNKLRKILEYKKVEERKQSFDFIAKLYDKLIIDENLNHELLQEFGLDDDTIVIDLKTWNIIDIKTTKVKIDGKTKAKTGYVLSSDIRNLFDDFTRYGVQPEDYLPKIYLAEKSKERVKEEELAYSVEHQKLREISKYLDKRGYKIASQHVDRNSINYVRVNKFLKTLRSNIYPQDVPTICIDSLDELFLAYYIFESEDDNAIMPTIELRNHMLKVFNIEEIGELYGKYESLKTEGIMVDRNMAGSIAALYIKSINEIIKYFREEIDCSVLRLERKSLTTKDFEKFREIRSLLIQKNDIPTARTKLIDYFEKTKMRKYIAAILNLQFGSNWFDEQVGRISDIREGIERTIKQKRSARADFEESYNKLDYSDLQHLHQIIFNRPNWNHCFRNIFGQSDENKKTLDVYWKQIYLVRTDFAHFSDSPKEALVTVFSSALWIIKWINKYATYFLTNEKAHINYIEEGEDVLGGPRVNVYFTDHEMCKEVVITEKDIEDISNYIQNNCSKNEILSIDYFITANGRKHMGLLVCLLKSDVITIKELTPDNITFFCNLEKLEKFHLNNFANKKI